MAELKSIQFKRGAQAALTTNLVGTNKLKDGEPAFEKDTGKLKIGNGVNDYADLPYIGGGGGGQDDRFVIHDPVAGQVLLYDDVSGKWVNKDLADENAIIYLAQHGLTLKGYAQASQGQMLVKDQTDGLAWIDPVDVSTLQAYLSACEQAAQRAGNYSTSAGNSASQADASATAADLINRRTMEYVNNKFWWGTVDEYNALESLNPGTFYFVTP